MKLFGTMNVIDNTLHIGGQNAVDLANEYGTPLYVIDEKLVRQNCRRYINSFKGLKGKNKVAYAGKAFLPKAMCQIINEEGLNLDVVSGGELYTAYKSNFPMERVIFHGNNKTVEEIKMGLNLGVGTFVVDSLYEIEKINEIGKQKSKKQKILMRITPGIEAHTHDYIKTGQIDSKFGFTMVENSILEMIKKVISFENINLIGFHCHIGSQIFDIEPYEDCAEIMMDLIKRVKDELNYEIKELDLGGGFGIYYSKGDKPKEIEEYCEVILNKIEVKCKELNMEEPKLTIEPGRSIIGNAGTTLYKIGAIKEIPNVRKYVAVDGGMTDNIRPALYKSQYECCIANNFKNINNKEVTICGKCCESGDILIEDTNISEAKSDDILAVSSTGAYCYSMSNNYNKIPKAAVALVKDGESKIICKRQTYEDIIKNEIAL
ncbi:diaminopimelate decarboxylase [Haloimpatiens sp. FM7330]|uniref:diaminopimelate decarboxylase n=1 Tax=Haloimpatiens sp. FM7330 TaxID=3298610 RepID=UPI00363CF5CE